jgi:acylphosphatase
MKTIHFIVKGKVQGVFFRAMVRRKALELGLVGYAKNLDDGDVEVVAQGMAEKIAALKNFMMTNPSAARVHDIREKTMEMEKFSCFDVL